MDQDDQTLLGHQDSEEGVLDDEPPIHTSSGSQEAVVDDRTDEGVLDRKVQFKKLPLGIWALEKIGLLKFKPLISHKALVFILTFVCYTGYHLTRKPTSVIKVVFCPVCAECVNWTNESNETEPGWAPFNHPYNGETLLGVIDYVWLFAYAIAMFVSGQIADRVNLRYFLTVGMLGSGVSVALLGITYFANIHMLWYFIVVQILGGVIQSTGKPGVVAVMSHWFGKQNRGLIMGVWNAHESVGNILGAIIPSFWAKCNDETVPWGWSFFVPGFIIFGLGIVIFLMLVVNPKHVGLPPPRHNLDDPKEATLPVSQSNRTYGRLRPDEDTVGEEDKKTEADEPLRQQEEEGDTSLATPTPAGRGGTEVQSKPKSKSKPVNILRAFLIPGVIEFSLALFFNKLVSYTFLFWLPFYVKNTLTFLTGPQSDWLSALYDVGGIIGGILAGIVSDQLRSRAITCVIWLILAIPSLFILDTHASESFGWFIVMLLIVGHFVTGPYSLITTAVSSDLGTHKSLRNNQNAKATVAAIIDGTGSLGAAFGPLIAGWVTNNWGWMATFYVLMSSCFLSALLLTRIVIKDVRRIYQRCRNAHRPSLPQWLFGRRRRSLPNEAPGVELTSISTAAGSS